MIKNILMLILIGQSVNLKSKFWPISENQKITKLLQFDLKTSRNPTQDNDYKTRQDGNF